MVALWLLWLAGGTVVPPTFAHRAVVPSGEPTKATARGRDLRDSRDLPTIGRDRRPVPEVLLVTTATVLLLVSLWAAVLVPGAWRDRRSSPRSTVDGFTSAMQRLATCDSRRVLVYGGPGREVHPARSARHELLEWRRMVLARLLGLVAASLLTAIIAGGWFWWTVCSLAVVACGAYVAALRALKVRRDQTRRVVQVHPAHRARVAARRVMDEYAHAAAQRSRTAEQRRAEEAAARALHPSVRADEPQELPWAVGR